MIIMQLLVLFITMSVQYGVLGRLALWHLAAPDLLLLSVWLTAWLGERNTAISYAMLLGLATSLINFQRFGIWLLVYVGIVFGIIALKQHFFEESSLVHALAVLLLANLFSLLVAGVIAGDYPLLGWLVNIAINLVLGAILYLFTARHLKLFQRWQGGRI